MRDRDLGPLPDTAFNATNKITHTVFSEMNTISQKHCMMEVAHIATSLNNYEGYFLANGEKYPTLLLMQIHPISSVTTTIFKHAPQSS